MLKTSLFSKGIYKSNLARFKWGSFLYFIILFFSTSFVLLISDYSYMTAGTVNRYMLSGGMILRDDYLIFPMLFASFVPTVTVFLSFDFFSSKKQSVFIHSLPCKRGAVYISSILGAYTLMAIPVILNGGVLMLISVFKLGHLFTLASCFKWICANLIVLFIMFSVALFSVSITSSKVSFVFINALLHFMPIGIAIGINSVAYEYLYGYADASGSIIETVIRWLPALFYWFNPVYATSVYGSTAIITNLLSAKTLIFCGGGILLIIVGAFLYLKRNVETAGNFVAFKVLNPILKYTLTSFSIIITFAILESGNMNRDFYMILLLFVVSFVVYFATEMVLKKNLKVFSAYKGYVALVAVFILLNAFMQYTSFFGFEKRIPQLENIESVDISNKSNGEFSDDETIILEALKTHEALIEDIPGIIKDNRYNTYGININYKLKNGKILKRLYKDLSQEEQTKILSKLYENKSYRIISDEFYRVKEEDVEELDLHLNLSGSYNHHMEIKGEENINKFFTEWRKDIESLGYAEKKLSDGLINVNINYKEHIFENNMSSREYVYGTSMNANFKNVIAFLKDSGYLGDNMYFGGYTAYITKKPLYVREEEHREYYKETMIYDVPFDSTVEISNADLSLLARDIISGEVIKNSANGENYVIYIMNESSVGFTAYSRCTNIAPDKLPEYLKKYIN